VKLGLLLLLVWFFLEVLRKQQAPADQASSKLDLSACTTANLWAMIQVHCELKLIWSHHFCGHPAVAPVITLHVFKTRVTLTAFDKLGDSVKALDKQIAYVQNFFDELHECVSKLEKKNWWVAGGGYAFYTFSSAISC
jgi:hypothetical protein